MDIRIGKVVTTVRVGDAERSTVTVGVSECFLVGEGVAAARKGEVSLAGDSKTNGSRTRLRNSSGGGGSFLLEPACMAASNNLQLSI